MTDTKLLREKIEASGLKLRFIADQLDISDKTLAMKIENRTQFKASEIVKLNELLHIRSADECKKIFLAQK